MANETRITENAKSGTLTPGNSLTNSATVMVSSALAAVAAVGATEHLALTLDPLGAGNGPEIVWVTAHTASSTGATIVRGREGTTGVAHTSTTAWVHGPTEADYVIKCTAATRPSGTGLPFEGQVIYETDTDKYQMYNGTAWRPLYIDGAWTAFTPTLSGTGWAIGNGTITGHYKQIGRHITGKITVTFGSTSTYGSAAMTIGGLPVAADANHGFRGHGVAYDASAVLFYPVEWIVLASASLGVVFCHSVFGTPAHIYHLGCTTSAPFAWATSDSVNLDFEYETAS